MKLSIFLATFLVTASALAAPATLSERRVLCNEINKQMEREEVDMGFEGGNCVKNRSIQSKVVAEGVIQISGNIVFRAPDRPDFKLKCTVAYDGLTVIENTLNCR